MCAADIFEFMLWHRVNAWVKASFVLSHDDMTRERDRTFPFAVQSRVSFRSQESERRHKHRKTPALDLSLQS